MVLCEQGAVVQRPATLLLSAVILFGAASCGGGGGSPSEPKALDLSGSWKGTDRDSMGQGKVAWVITQNGSQITASLNVVDTGNGRVGNGTVTGTLSGSSLTFAMSVPIGGFSPPYQVCSLTVFGTALVDSGSIEGQYVGQNSCTGAIEGGQLTLIRA